MAATPVPETAPHPERTALQIIQDTHDILMMVYPKTADGNFHHNITQDDVRTIYDMIAIRKNTKRKLLICLDTGGGNVYAAVKIMNILRHRYPEDIMIAVMEEAKSSGTMMCLAANSIVMSHASELGPLDKPLQHPNDETYTISALDITKSLDAIIDTALDKQKQLARTMIGRGLKRQVAYEVSGKAIAELMSPLLAKQDVMIYNQALRLLRMAEVYGKKFLNQYSLKWIKDDNLRNKITDIVIERLIWSYPDHNFAICRDDCENDLLLHVKKAEETGYWDDLWKRFSDMIDSTEKKFTFLD